MLIPISTLTVSPLSRRARASMLFCFRTLVDGMASFTYTWILSCYLDAGKRLRFVCSGSTNMTTKKHMRSEGKQMVAKVYHWVKHEAEHGVENVFAALWRTSQATGVSVKTIAKLMGEDDTVEMDTSNDTTEKPTGPATKRKKIEKGSLEDVEMSLFRKTIISHADSNEPLTLKRLKQVLGDKMNFDGSLAALRGLLMVAGFEWSKTEDNRKLIRENHEIKMWRFRYLKQLRKYREERRYIVFTDESCVNVDKEKLKNNTILVHAGGSQGSVPNALLILKANKSGDYSDNNYKKWVEAQLLPNIPKNSVIIIGNAPYHNVLTETIPSHKSKKSEILAWLTSKNIPFEDSMQKIEVYDLVIKNKDKFKKYVIEELCISKGFEVLRLPPHHSELNPLEMIWGIVKGNEDVTNKLLEASLTTILREKIDPDTWESVCKIVEQTEKEYMEYFERDKENIAYYDDSTTEDSDFEDSESE